MGRCSYEIPIFLLSLIGKILMRNLTGKEHSFGKIN